MTDVSVSIIIVNFHSEEEIINCIQSIEKNTNPNIVYEIIIVSNSQLTERQRHELKKFQNITLIQSTKNRGFAWGCNKGADRASGEFFFFLNPDSEFKNDVLFHLRAFYRKCKNPGIVVPFVYNNQDQLCAVIRNNLGFWPLVSGAFPFLNVLMPRKYHVKHIKPDNTMPIDAAKGSALFISKSLFNDLGGMDEDFFMYWEENDIFLRAQQADKKNYITETAKVIHLGGISTSPHFNDMFLIMHISKKRFVMKHHPKLLTVSRILSIIGYSWRTLIATLLFNKKKIQQFYTALKWYLIKFNNENFTRNLIEKYKRKQ